jgi:NADPH:quinone reductase-like Zn-dependent oxidoreductase
MKAVFIRSPGGPEAVQVGELPDPVAAEGEVLVAVRAAALNHLDLWVRGGRSDPSLKMPHVLGSDAAGVVMALGPRVHGVKEGDEVVIYPGLSCGCCEFCRRGEQSECAAFGIIGLSRPGTYAERVAVPMANVHPKPAHLDFPEAAALTLVFTTAWRMLMTRAKLRPGETVLIHGIGGGVSLAALQFAKLIGAEVIVTSSSDAKLSAARKLGADHAINYKTSDVAKSVRDLTRGRGVDVSINTVGAAAWAVDIACVRRGGRIAICGVTTGATAETDLRSVYWNQISLFGSTLGSHEDLRQMLRAVAENKLRPVIDSMFPLSRAAEALARMESGSQFGKIVLNVSL